MPSRARGAVGLFILVVGGFLAARLGIRFGGPHVVLASAPALNAEKRRDLAKALAMHPPLTLAEMRDFALDYTAKSLRFSLGHPISYQFDLGVRDGNCVEYSYLFAQAFNAAAGANEVARGGVRARAFAVRSTHANFFGAAIPLAGFEEHDWVLIVGDGAGGERMYVDPTLYDAHLGWNVKWNVDSRP